MSNKRKIRSNQPRPDRLHYVMGERPPGNPEDDSQWDVYSLYSEITWPHICSELCFGQSNDRAMRYPCCIICGHNSPGEDAEHYATVHPKVVADSIELRMQGYTGDAIDEIILSQQYLEGRLPGFPGAIEFDHLTVIQMRYNRNPPIFS